MKAVLAFGDSNTWGLIPGARPAQRYPWGVRWTSRLQEQCRGIRVIEEGLCGRTTVFEDAFRQGRKGVASLPAILETHRPLDAVIIMLGTNDCKTVYGVSAYAIGKGLELCLDEIGNAVPNERILLVSPILLGSDVWKPDKDPEFGLESVEICRALKGVYKGIAASRGTAFLAASDYAAANHADEEHMDEEGHRAFASAVHEKLKEMGIAG